MKLLKGVATCICLLSMGAAVALAQLPTATILGQVQDASGAILPGVELTARNTDTGQTRTVTTGDDGAYRFDGLPVGNYEVRAEKTGFKSAVHSGLTLTVAQQAVINITLELGETTQSVTVTGEAPLVNTTSSSLGGLVDEKRIVDLPLNGRNYLNLTLMQPGVTQFANNGQGPTQGIEYSSNGAPLRANNYLLDGAILQNVAGFNGASVVGNTLGVEGIREYRIITNSFSAEYGMAMGSQMVLVSRGGTNQFHGDAFEFLRNSSLDARNFFDATPAQIGHRLPEFRRNNFGGSFGGPIKKDKTFFFGVYEQLEQALGTTNRPTSIEAGCHGAANAVVWNGVGTQPPGSIGPCISLGNNPAGATLPYTVTIQPQIAPLLNEIYPIPNAPNNQYAFPFAQPTTEHYGQLRIDQTISSKDSFFGRYTIDDATQTSSGAFPGFSSGLQGRNQYLTLAEDHVITTTLLNSVRFSFSRTNQFTTTSSVLHGPQFDFTGIPAANQLPGEIDLGGVTTLTGTTPPGITKQNIFTGSDDVYYSHGRNSFKFGVVFNHFQQYFSTGGGIGSFLSGQVQFADVAHFLLAQPKAFVEAGPNSNSRRIYHFNIMGFYAQDDLRLTKKLTLNLGLRYEPETTYEETTGHGAGLRNDLTDATFTPGPPLTNPSWRNFGPRIGFAWDPAGNGRTAIRGGAALLYDLLDAGSQLGNAAGSAPYASTATITPPPPLIFTIPFTIQLNTVVQTSFHGPDYLRNQTHMYQYNLTVERQLPFGMCLSLAYVGARGLHVLQTVEGNPAIPLGIPVNGACVAPPAGQTVNLTSMVDGIATACWLPVSSPPTPTSTVRINPAWGSLGVSRTSGDSFYNGMELVINKRLSRGLQLQSAFTWSKLIDHSEGLGGADNSQANNTYSVDPFHPSLSRGPGDFDITDNWRLNAIYNLPAFSSTGRIAEKFLNGWWVSGILAAQTGSPFNVYLNSNRAGSLVGAGVRNLPDRPDIVAGRNNSNITQGASTGCSGVLPGTPLGTPTLYYDPCAFTIQPPGFLGNEGRNILRGPGLANLDFSVVKDTALRVLGESGNIQFRTEVFNVTNHTNFSLPGAYVFAGTASVQAPLSTAGVINSTSTNSRQIQFALKVIF